MLDPEANPSGEPVEAEPKPEPQPEPAQAAPPKEEPVEPPPWLNAPLDATPAPPQPEPYYGGPYPQYPPSPPPGYYGPPPPTPYAEPQPPDITLQDLAGRPGPTIRGTARQEALQLAMPLAQQLARVTQELESLRSQAGNQQTERVVADFENARATIRNTFQQQWSRDPALKNPAVQQRVWAAVEGYLREGAMEAKFNGTTRKWRTLQDPRALNLILYDAKQQAGWSDQTQRIDIQGGFVESSRSAPQSGSGVTDEMREAARHLGIDESVLAKRLEERKKLGWD